MSAVTPKAGRTCRWVVRPYRTPAGATVGAFAVTVAGRTDCYRLFLDGEDDFGQRWGVEKELPDGSFAEPYWVTLPAPGVYGPPTCTCPGAKYARRTCDHRGRVLADAKCCRHAGALQALLSHLQGS